MSGDARLFTSSLHRYISYVLNKWHRSPFCLPAMYRYRACTAGTQSSCHIHCTLTAFFVFEQAKKQYAGGDHEAAYRSSHTAAAIRACGLCCAAPIVTALPIVMVLLFAISGIIGSQN